MSDFKEFEGKSLDAAIAEACTYYDAPREKLEIDIVQDSKSGIFGLVGARKALIKARVAQLPEMAKKGQEERKTKRGSAKAPARAVIETPETVSPQEDAPSEAPEPVADGAPKQGRRGKKDDPEPVEKKPEEGPKQQRGRHGNSDRADESPDRSEAKPPRGRLRSDNDAPGAPDSQEVPEAQDISFPKLAIADLDQDKLVETTNRVIDTLIRGIVDEVAVEVRPGDDRVVVQINGDDTGLLIGREGQNLAAVQYLAARIISREMDAQIRLQVDAGDYHSRQDSRLKDMALGLADKVRTTGKSMSTKPLSVYQRRVIHLTLQEDPDIYTRSSGEGALKRVVVMRRKDN